jgi:hypothetical protein
MRVLLISALTLLVTGCATGVLKSDQNEVVTDSFTPNFLDSQRVADAECAKYNKIAKLKSGVNAFDRKVTFDCVDSDKKDNQVKKNSGDIYTELKNLKELLNSQTITQEEFNTMKKAILNKYNN